MPPSLTSRPGTSDDDQRTLRWQKLEISAAFEKPTGDPLHALRGAIGKIRVAPGDDAARKALRDLAVDQDAWEQLALLLADEARAASTNAKPHVAAAFYEELADVYENLDQPLETIAAMEALVALCPTDLQHRDRLAWLYRRSGATVKAAETFEQVAALARDDRGRAALRAAGKLYRETGRLDRALAMYRSITERRPSDIEAWRALDEILTELEQWREVATVRSVLAEHATGVDKAVMLRAQARALEQAGEASSAADLVASAARHAPDDISGVVDYATILTREGKTSDAAEMLTTRLRDAVRDAAPSSTIAALRLRLVDTYETAGDKDSAARVLEELLTDAPDYAPARERLLEVARRQRDAGDIKSALRTFERARDLAPGDFAFAAELADLRSAAKIEATLVEGERLARTDRHAAIRFLRGALGHAAEGTAPAQLARLIHAISKLNREIGDTDEAHRLLHEAHHLARRDLAITLALGESCFGRKLWREAAIHLGSLADHPDAAKHARAVALGLVKAGQAEFRALKPTNAPKHFEAAIRIDPTCGPAWHQLAELASERGDFVRAAECLEREAAATTDTGPRVRLHEALGDLYQDVLSDAVSAERVWTTVAAEATASVLDKLLGLLRKRGAGVERAAICERRATFDPDSKLAKDLHAEAIEQLVAAGELPRARGIADALIAKYPLDVDALVAATTVASAQGDHVAAGNWLRKALVTWDVAHKRGDGDPRRADLWRRLGDAERAQDHDRPALDAYQRALQTAPDSPAALAARRGLIELASSFGRRADTSRLALVEAEQEPADVLAGARALAAAAKPGLVGDARNLFELARALGVELMAEDEQFLAAHPARTMASDEAYAATLDDAERRALIDDEDEGPLADLLAIVAEALPLISPDAKTALLRAELRETYRPPATSDAAVLAIYPQVAKSLGGVPAMLYASPSREQADLQLLLASPAVIVLGPRLVALRARSRADVEFDADAELRFRLGRIVELARPHRLLASGVDAVTFETFVAALLHAFGKPGASVSPTVAREAERLHQAFPVALRRRLTERLATLAPGSLDARAYIAACERAADRAGLVACGQPAFAIHLAGGPERARHLVALAASQRYLAAQRKLRRS